MDFSHGTEPVPTRSQNIEPEQPFKDSFNIRTGSHLHRRAAIAAKQRGINLNKLVNEAIEQYLKNSV